MCHIRCSFFILSAPQTCTQTLMIKTSHGCPCVKICSCEPFSWMYISIYMYVLNKLCFLHKRDAFRKHESSLLFLFCGWIPVAMGFKSFERLLALTDSGAVTSSAADTAALEVWHEAASHNGSLCQRLSVCMIPGDLIILTETRTTDVQVNLIFMAKQKTKQTTETFKRKLRLISFYSLETPRIYKHHPESAFF